MDKPNRFLDNMASYGLGNLVDELADYQQKVIEAVRTTRKMGKLVLELKFKPNGKHQIEVEAVTKPTIPRLPVERVQMFADDENLLHEQDPDNKQTSFADNVSSINEHKKEVKDA